MPITEEFVKHLMEQNAAMMVSKNRLLTRIAAYASHQAKNRAVRKDTKENTFLSLPIRIMWSNICIPHAAAVLIMIPVWSMPV